MERSSLRSAAICGIGCLVSFFFAAAAPVPALALGGDECGLTREVRGEAHRPGSAASRSNTWRPSYCLVDLGTVLNDNSSFGVSINNHGEIVGNSGNGRSFIYKDGRLLQIEPLPGDDSISVFGINDSGVVVGTSLSTKNFSGNNPLMYSQGKTIPIPALQDAIPYAINNSGQVAGGARELGPFLYSNGIAISLGKEGGVAYGTNEKGDVVGTSETGRAFLYSDGRAIDLGTLPGDTSSSAQDINDNGQVVGFSAQHGVDDGRAFLYSSGTGMMSLGRLRPSDAYSIGMAINKCGHVVGFSGSNANFYALSELRAFLYADGQITDLNKTIPRRSNVLITAAVSINDRGEIVGRGSRNGQLRAVLLTPGRQAAPCGSGRDGAKRTGDIVGGDAHRR